MLIFITSLCLLVGPSVADTSFFRVLREYSNESIIYNSTDGRQPRVYECHDVIEQCDDVLTVRVKVPKSDENGITFSRENVDSVCSAGAQFIPCVEALPFNDYCKAWIKPTVDLYKFGCVTNRKDIYNFIPCANKKMVQIQTYSVINYLQGVLRAIDMLMYEQMTDDQIQIQIPTEAKKRVFCRAMRDGRSRISSLVRHDCNKKQYDTINEVLDTNPFKMFFYELLDEPLECPPH